MTVTPATDNSTKIATTAFVQSVVGALPPLTYPAKGVLYGSGTSGNNAAKAVTAAFAARGIL